MTLDEYFEMEYAAEERHEYINGKTRTMAYASENHRQITKNLVFLLESYFRNRDEMVYTNQTLVFTAECNKGFYPDVTIFPPNIEYQKYRGKMKAALNPTVIIEVLSDSTAHIDRGEKLECYKTLPSLNQYLLVSQHQMRIESYTRHNGNGDWLYRDFVGEKQDVPIGECALALEEIYHKVVFEKTEEKKGG